jgi:hypothetical protein
LPSKKGVAVGEHGEPEVAMMLRAFLAATILVCSTALAVAQPLHDNTTKAIHLHVGETVYAASSRSVAYAPCETPPGAKPWLGNFPKPKLDANGTPEALFSYRAGDPLKVVAMHTYVWSYEGSHSERFWTMETRDRHRFCLRDAQLDDSVVASPKQK